MTIGGEHLPNTIYYCPNCGSVQKEKLGNECVRCRWLCKKIEIPGARIMSALLVVGGSILIPLAWVAILTYRVHEYAGGYPYRHIGIPALLTGIILIVVGLIVRGKELRKLQNTAKAIGFKTYGAPKTLGVAGGVEKPETSTITREIVKVPCKYCSTLVEVTQSHCPACGGPLR